MPGGTADAYVAGYFTQHLAPNTSHRTNMHPWIAERTKYVDSSTVPCSSRRYHSVSPPVSHHSALMRSRLRLTNRNNAPSVTL